MYLKKVIFISFFIITISASNLYMPMIWLYVFLQDFLIPFLCDPDLQCVLAGWGRSQIQRQQKCVFFCTILLLLCCASAQQQQATYDLYNKKIQNSSSFIHFLVAHPFF
jgi:hypothetical protein